MIKADIVKHVAKSCGLEPDIASLAVESTLDAIKRGLLSGQNVYIRGFATFGLRTAAEKVARNISQNTFVTIPAHTIIKFIPSPRLADAISPVAIPAKETKTTRAKKAKATPAKYVKPALTDEELALYCAKAAPVK